MRWIVVSIVMLVGCGGGGEPSQTSDAGPAGSSPAGANGGGGGGGQQSSAGSAGGEAGATGGATAETDGGATAGTGGVPQSDGGVTSTSCGLRISQVKAVDDGGGSVFVAPEGITVRALVENTGDAKGPIVLRAASDDPRVVPVGSAETRIDALAAGAQEMMAVSFTMPKQVWPGSEIAFSLTAAVAADATCSTTTADPFVVTTGDSADDLRLCDITRQLQLSDPHVKGAAVDGRILPDTDVVVDVLMTNPGPLDHKWYPSVILTSDDADLKPSFPGGVYVLNVNRTSRITAMLHVAASTPHGTHATVTATASAAQVRCRGLQAIEVPVAIE